MRRMRRGWWQHGAVARERHRHERSRTIIEGFHFSRIKNECRRCPERSDVVPHTL